jgi:hypothetical protein
MAVLSNNGRLISSLPLINTIVGSDEMLVQSNGITKRISYATLSASMFDSLNPYGGQVNFTNANNKFTGSLKGNSSGTTVSITAGTGLTGGGQLTTTRTLSVDTSTIVTIANTQTITGIKTFQSTKATGSFSGSIYGGIISKNTKATGSFKGTKCDLSGSFSGSSFGYFKGDLYTKNGDKVLENGTSANPGGNVPSAYFYGTSSYANQSLTAAYALAGGENGNVPTGGSQYQVLNKLSATDNDTGWVTPVTRSGVPDPNYLSYWTNGNTLAGTSIVYNHSANILYFNPGTISVTSIQVSNAITGSFKGNTDVVTIESGDLYQTITGHLNSTAFLELSASGYVTLSLMSGQTTTVLVQNTGNYKVLKWSGSLDGGATANTKIYWKNGLSSSITQGDQKKDVITFININDKIFGSSVNNFS